MRIMQLNEIVKQINGNGIFDWHLLQPPTISKTSQFKFKIVQSKYRKMNKTHLNHLMLYF